MANIFLLAITALLIENFVFVKFYGICPFLGVSQKTETAVGMGLAVTFTMTIASALTWPLYHFILKPLHIEYLETALGIYLPLITTNCAVLGVALLNVQNDYNFIESVVYGFAAGLGFLLAIFLLSLVRERFEFAKIPKPFRGVPIALIAGGLLALAFSGLRLSF